MLIGINVKGASKKVTQLVYEYEYSAGDTVAIGDFLDATVEITYKRYIEAVTDKGNVETGNSDYIYDKSDRAVSLFKVLTRDEIDEMAEEGKISFGVHYNTNKISLDKAKENARQCFLDGIVALFIDEERYESLDEKVVLRDGGKVSFVKMTFLAGRIW